MHRWYEYDANVLVVLAIAALAILACVVLVSLGRGGELTEFPPDVPPLDLPEPGQLTAVDFMALQLPVNLVGYHTQSVDETLRRAATAISARDTRIAVLEQRVSELLSSRLHARQEVYASPGNGPRTDHRPEPPAAPMTLPEAGDPGTTVAHVPDFSEPEGLDGPAGPPRAHEAADWDVPDEAALASDRPEPPDAVTATGSDEPAEHADERARAGGDGAGEPGEGDEPVRAASGKDGEERE